MSRDFTPRESLAAEKYTGISLWHFMETTVIIYNGEEKLLHDPADVALRKEYPLLGKLINDFPDLYAQLIKIDGGLDILREKDNELAIYIEQGKGDFESYLVRWFEGELDTNFYYSERNEEMFIEEIVREAQEKKKED